MHANWTLFSLWLVVVVVDAACFNQSIKSQGSIDVTVDDLYVNTKVGGDMGISSSTPTSPDSTATTPEVSGVVQEDLLYVNTQVGGGGGGSTTGGKLRKLSVSGFLFCFTLLFLLPPHFAYNITYYLLLFPLYLVFSSCIQGVPKKVPHEEMKSSTKFVSKTHFCWLVLLVLH